MHLAPGAMLLHRFRRGVLLCFLQIVYTVKWGKKCGNDPWDARTLEWSLPSPVPAYNFAKTPIVPSRDCWFEHKHGGRKLKFENDGGEAGVHMPSQSWTPMVSGSDPWLTGQMSRVARGGGTVAAREMAGELGPGALREP